MSNTHCASVFGDDKKLTQLLLAHKDAKRVVGYWQGNRMDRNGEDRKMTRKECRRGESSAVTRWPNNDDRFQCGDIIEGD